MTPAESFNFMGVQLHDPEALRKYTRGCIGVSKFGQKIFVGVAFPLVFVLALLFPVNAVVYFNIRHLLHKDWTPSLVGFISGLIAILFFLYWLVPAACRYIYDTLYKGDLKKIEKMAKGIDDLDMVLKAKPYIKGVDPSILRAVQETKLDEKSVRAAADTKNNGMDLRKVRDEVCPVLKISRGLDIEMLSALKRVYKWDIEIVYSLCRDGG